MGYNFKVTDYNSDTDHIHIKDNVIIWSLFYFVFNLLLMYIKISIKSRLASLQLPAKYPQLSPLLIGQIETLI